MTALQLHLFSMMLKKVDNRCSECEQLIWNQMYLLTDFVPDLKFGKALFLV